MIESDSSRHLVVMKKGVFKITAIVLLSAVCGIGGYILIFEDKQDREETTPQPLPVADSESSSPRPRENLDWLSEATETEPEALPVEGSLPPGAVPTEISGPAAVEPPRREEDRTPPPIGAPIMSRSYEVSRAVDAEAARLGPMLAERGREWLGSEEDLTRAAGAIALAKAGALTEEDVATIANDSEWSVPFLTLEALETGGSSDEAAMLRSQIAARGPSAADLVVAQENQAFSFGGGEAVIDYARDAFDPEEAELIAETFSEDATLPYEARMKAAWEKRKAVPVSEYRDYLTGLKTEGESADASEWNEGLDRLEERWTGPDPVLNEAPVLDELTVHQAFGQENERMLTDFRFELDYVLSHEEGQIGIGTADVLQEYLVEFDQRPWSEAENSALRQLALQVEELRLEETNVQSIDSPPGAE